MHDQWIDWLQVSRRHFFYGVLVIVAAFFVAFQIYERFTKPQINQVLTASAAYDKWAHQGEAFENLEAMLDARPELETKFGALIAKRFIVQNEGDRAEPYAQNVFDRVLKHTPDHAAFANGSLLIAKGSLEEALVESVALKERLSESSLLYGFNLVRIASLYRETEALEEERIALKELERYLADHEDEGQVIRECFRIENTTLDDYIEHRKR